MTKKCMRIRPLLLAALLGAALVTPATASDPDAAWATCSAPQTSPKDRIVRCSTVITLGFGTAQLRAQALAIRGTAWAYQGDEKAAVADLDASLALHPNTNAYGNRAGLRMRNNDFDQALPDLDRAIALDARNAELRRFRAYVHMQRKDDARAIADLTAMIELTPRSAPAYALRAMIYENADERRKAIADYRKALEIDPDHNNARRFLARLGGTPPESAKLPPGRCSGEAEKTSDQDRIEGCTEVIKSGKYSGWTLKTAYCNRAYALTELGEYDRVIADSNALLKIDANASCAYQNRGRAWYYKKNLDRAIDDYNRAIKIEPTFHEAFSSRGTAYHDRFEFDLAIADYDQALRIEPDDKDVQAWRANSLRLKGIYADAIADLTRQIERTAENTERYRRRGEVYAARGDLDRAIADYTAAIELEPNESSHWQARAKIYDLKGETRLAAADRADAEKRQFNRLRSLLEQPRETKP
jgi:tetratricopeptide (TPR) repeat protein